MELPSTVLLVILGLVLFAAVLLLVLIRPAVPRAPRPSPDPSHPSPSGEVATPAVWSAQPSHSQQSFVLSAVAGSRAGERFVIPPAGLSIGRGPGNDVILAEPMVSRQHAQILPATGGFVLNDRNSSNGVFVDGVRTFQRRLEPGNRVQIGLAEFIFHDQNDPHPFTPPGHEAPAHGSAQFAAPPSANAFGAPLFGAASFGEYRLEGLLGGGGMAEVYRARAPGGRLVAIKIPKVASDAYVMKKFEKEGNRIGALLRGHPHVVEIERFAYNGAGVPYIVMEYVDGGSLRDRLRKELSEEEIRRILGQTCLALAFAHEYSIVHCDIKPENILLTAAGVVKVADFGIAKELSGVTVTHKGPVGTPEYMSPEQANGDKVLPASDVYAVGVVAYELLTGQAPFPRRASITDDIQQALDVVNRHIQEPPRPPRQLRASVPAALEAFTLKALQKDPRKRYKDGKDAAKALGFSADALRSGAAAKPDARRRDRVVANLVIVEGPRQGSAIRVAGEWTTIGRPDVDPDNLEISRRHVVLQRRGDDFWIEDVSANGTWVNNQRAAGEQLVVAGDLIRMGSSVLRLEL